VFTERQALHWFAVMATYDWYVTPQQWVWGAADHEANAVLNASLFSDPKMRQLGTGTGGSQPSLWGVAESPPPLNAWRSDRGRTCAELVGGAGWLPRYFPEDTNDVRILVTKNNWVLDSLLADTEMLKTLISVDGKPMPPCAQPPALDSDYETYFSINQYLRFTDYVAKQVPNFATDADSRAALFCQWTEGCFAWGDSTFSATLASLGELTVIPTETAGVIWNMFIPEGMGSE